MLSELKKSLKGLLFPKAILSLHRFRNKDKTIIRRSGRAVECTGLENQHR